MPPPAAAVTSVTRPFVVSTVVPTGIWSPALSVLKPFLPGCLIFTVPLTGSALTFLPATGGGGGLANPRTTTTRLPPPKVENRKSPVCGSIERALGAVEAR